MVTSDKKRRKGRLSLAWFILQMKTVKTGLKPALLHFDMVLLINQHIRVGRYIKLRCKCDHLP